MSETSDEIAVRIMGWRQGERSWAYSGGAILWYDERGTGLMPVQAWIPDEDEHQCWQVVDRMLALGFSYTMRESEGVAHVRFFRSGDPETAETSGQQRRLAILQAALKAVG